MHIRGGASMSDRDTAIAEIKKTDKLWPDITGGAARAYLLEQMADEITQLLWYYNHETKSSEDKFKAGCLKVAKMVFEDESAAEWKRIFEALEMAKPE